MAKKNPPSDDDIDLFRRSVGPVRKVAQDRAAHARQAPSPRPRKQSPEDTRPVADGFSDGYDIGSVAAEETLFFARPGLQQRQLQRLRRGQLSCGAELDMHGMTIAVARQELVDFIAHCRDRNLRCVRIIHGKGYGSGNQAPVLKNKLNNWLRQLPEVLAFSSTQLRDGGTGAVYVLLKSQR